MITGIDLSHYNDVTDWGLVRQHADFAYLKASNGVVVDPTFDYRLEHGARQMPLGAYHFFKPLEDWGVQANLFIAQALKLGPGQIMPMLDLEWSNSQGPTITDEWQLINAVTAVANVRAFLAKLGDALRIKPVVYTNHAWYAATFGFNACFADLAFLAISRYGAADPGPLPTGWDDWTIWQDACDATVPGVTGPVDTDKFKGTVAELLALGK